VYDGAVLDLSKVKESGVLKVKASLIDGIKMIEMDEINVQVVVSPTTTRTMPGTAINVTNAAAGYKAVIQLPEGGKLDLVLSGAESVLAGVRADAIRVEANLEGLGAGVHEVPLQITLPPFVEALESEQQKLVATIEIIDTTAVEAPEEEEAVETGGTATDG